MANDHPSDDQPSNDQPGEEQIEMLLRGSAPEASPAVAQAVRAIRALGGRPLADEMVARHVAMIAGEAARSPRWDAAPVAAPKATRRRVVVNAILSSLLVKVMSAAVAVAAVGTGVGIAADASVPGEPLHGLDRALERAGIGAGGAIERIEEARSLVAVDLPAAVESAALAADVTAPDSSEAVAALAAAALRVGGSTDGEHSALTREQVAALVDEIASQLQNEDGFDAQAVVDRALMIRPDAQLPEPVPQDEVPPMSLPPGEIPPESPVPTIPHAPPSDTTGAPPASDS